MREEVCVCVCVWERERERVCVSVRVCVRGRERERGACYSKKSNLNLFFFPFFLSRLASFHFLSCRCFYKTFQCSILCRPVISWRVCHTHCLGLTFAGDIWSTWEGYDSANSKLANKHETWHKVQVGDKRTSILHRGIIYRDETVYSRGPCRYFFLILILCD
jgi:hypothetical protein